MNASQTTPRLLEDADDEPEQPPSPTGGLTLAVEDETGELTGDELVRLRRAIRSVATIAVGAEGGHDVRVRVVGDALMSELHERHSGIVGTTDVLTFDLRESADGALDVDIAVCLDEARRASADRVHDAVDELTLYALHGVLHCAGHDDHDDVSYRAMHEREDAILREAGLGARFFNDNDGDGA